MLELWFLCIALLQNVFHYVMKVQADRFHRLKVMAQTKIQAENRQRAITKKR